ncbi:MAG TPA: hypothetical protein PKA06_11490 [Gemmatales bacterium]|nr:hypothetical protein [Gemmatales bacterium]
MKRSIPICGAAFTHGVPWVIAPRALPPTDITSKVYGIIDPQDADLNRLREWQDAGMLEAEAKVVWSWPDPDRPKLIIREVTKNDWEVSRQH